MRVSLCVCNRWSIMLVTLFTMVLSRQSVAQPALTGMSIQAGKQGVAVAIECNQAVDALWHVKNNKDNTRISITVKSGAYRLGADAFSDFPSTLPIRKIVALEDDNGVTIDIICTRLPPNSVQVKIKESRSLILVSSKPVQAYEWQADTRSAAAAGTQPSAREVPSPVTVSRSLTARAAITGLKFNQKGPVDELIIRLDTAIPLSVQMKQKDNAFILVSQQATNGLDKSDFSFLKSRFLRNVSIHERRTNGTEIVGIVIKNSDNTPCAARVKCIGATITIHAATADYAFKGKYAGWTGPLNESGLQTDIAVAGAKNVVPSSQPTPQQTVQSPVAMPSVAEPRLPRVVVVSDRMKVRLKPHGTALNKPLYIGLKGNRIQTKAGWVLVRFDDDGTQGWLSASSVKDSIKLTQEQWAGINSFLTRLQTVDASNVPVSTLPNAEKKQGSMALPKPASRSAPEGSSAPLNAVTPVPTTATAASVAAGTQPRVSAAPFALQQGEVSKHISRYNARGRDPFYPMDSLSAQDSEKPDVEICKLVGVIYDQKDKVVLLEDEKGLSFSLRERDEVSNGRLVRIQRDCAVFLLRNADFVRQFILKLNIKKD
ncbi:MAG: hypothetical protein JW795_06790 [Chitinivibrionales bacterium]|nr:hypothetical protein [Chitinivibrionales bacterium]